MPRLFRSLVLLWSVLFALSGIAAPSAAPEKRPHYLLLDCLAAFQAFYEKREIKTDSERFFKERHELAKKHTVKILEDEEEAGQHGGRLIKLKRIGKSWASNGHSNGHDPQGDPRVFIDLLGAKEAEFFGFKMLDDETMLIPDQAEFMGALKKINERLKEKGLEPVELNFYQTATESNVSVTDYTLRFANEGSIPMAPPSLHQVHDISLHTGAILIPNSALRKLRARQQYHLDFISFLKNKYADADPAAQKAVNFYTYLIKHKDTQTIDSFTARVGEEILSAIDDPSKIGGAANTLRSTLTVAPAETLGDDFKYKFFKIFFPASIPLIENQEARLAPHLAALPLEKITADFNEFNKTYTGNAILAFDPLKPLTTQKQHELCDEIMKQRAAIRDAARELQR